MNTRAKPDSSEAVDAFMATLAHPCKAEVQALREMILTADPSIGEGVKWNAPSYRTRGEYFATTHLRAKSGIGIILHLGAKRRELLEGGVVIDDPQQLLKWLAKDRAILEFADMVQIASRGEAFQTLLRQWIAHV